MRFKKILASMAAAAVVVASAMSLSIGVSAEGFPSKAYLCGQLGATAVWKPEEVTAGSTVADVNGDAQYEVEWVVSDGGTGTLEFLIVSIPDVTTDQYPDMQVTLDKVIIDGVEQTGYTVSPNAINMAYYENSGSTRIYLHNSWVDPKISDLPAATTITQSIKVLFTISGTGMTGTSNVTSTDSNAGGDTTATDATGGDTTPTDATGGATTATDANSGNNTTNTNGAGTATTNASNNSSNSTTTTVAAGNSSSNNNSASNNNTSSGGGAVLGNSTQTNSATTGDAGVAIAVAGMVLTSGIAATAVMMRKKK